MESQIHKIHQQLVNKEISCRGLVQEKLNLLKQIWKYSEGADTHTVETHIYRLRKKILAKFNDDSFIINSKTGYSI